MNEYLSRRAGFVGVCVLVAFVAVWLSTSGKKALRPVMQSLPELHTSAELDRFLPQAAYLPNEPLLGFVKIPAGPFLMGSDPEFDRMAYATERWSSESYQGKVELPDFYIGRYEVTVAQFHAFVAATRHPIDRSALEGAPSHPIAQITWTEAIAYAKWLNTMLRDSVDTPEPLRQLLSDGWRVALPSEAQWEKAARGSDGRLYPWGNTSSIQHANFHSVGTKPVGSLQWSDCAYQLADLSGNVWEMTRSALRPYPFVDKPVENLPVDALFVMRGGSYSELANNVRSAIRGGIDPGARSPQIGFRLVIERT